MPEDLNNSEHPLEISDVPSYDEVVSEHPHSDESNSEPSSEVKAHTPAKQLTPGRKSNKLESDSSHSEAKRDEKSDSECKPR